MSFDFSSVSARYAAFRPTYPPALVDALAAVAGTGTAWDIGCGTGQLSLGLAERFARVIATDPSQAQLDAAPPHPRIEYRCASAEASGLPDHCADLAVAAQAAHWFDWPRFLVEVARVTRPGGVVALVTYGNPVLDGEAGALYLKYRTEIAGPYWPPERHHVETSYRDLVLPWPALPSPSLDIVVSWTRDDLLGYVSSSSATTRMIAALGPAPFEQLCEQLAAAWPTGERTVRWPLTVKLARLLDRQ